MLRHTRRTFSLRQPVKEGHGGMPFFENRNAYRGDLPAHVKRIAHDEEQHRERDYPHDVQYARHQRRRREASERVHHAHPERRRADEQHVGNEQAQIPQRKAPLAGEESVAAAPEHSADDAPGENHACSEHEHRHRHHGAREATSAFKRCVGLKLALEDRHEGGG